MMRQMRDNMKAIMIVTSVAFVGLMVFGWGMDISGRGSGGPGVLGKVNGQPITYEEFNATYRNLYDQEQKARQDPITSTVNKQIEKAAWDQLVMQKLIGQELDRRGIRVSDAEVRQAAKYAPPPEFTQNQLFQTNGQFDLQKYRQFLASPAVDNQLLMQLEAYYRDVIPRSKLYYQVVSGVYIPDSYLWTMWRDTHETAKARFIAIDPSSMIPDARVSITGAEVSQYYDKHKANFERPATARIVTVAIPKVADARDTALTRDSLLALRKAIEGGANFAQVAQKASKDPGSAAQGGELGTVKKGQTVPAFEQAVFSLPLNQLSEPVLTQFGFHLIQVQSRTGDEATVRHILLPIVPAGPHLDQLLARADSMEKAGETRPVTEVAQEMGLTPRTSDVTKEIPAVPGVGRIDEGVDWVFGDAQPKEVSQVYESPTAFYMVELLSRTPAGPLPLSAASPTIRTILALQKKMELARDMARQMVDQVRSGQSLDQVAASHGVQVQTAGPFTHTDFVPGMGQANAAIGTVFGLNPGQVSGVVEANKMLYIIQTVEKQPANRPEFDKQKEYQRAQMASAMADQRWQQFLAGLRQSAKIVDNREKVLRPAKQDTATAGLGF